MPTDKDWTGNGNSVWKTLGASNHTDKEREERDFYATEPTAIDKLLRVDKPRHLIWECAAGEGHLSERLKHYGYEVCSTDIVERDYPLDGVCDFLSLNPKDIEEGARFDILTNPPFKKGMEFILKALELLPDCCSCYMFLKVTFLEGKKRYQELFSKYPPSNVYVFSERILCAKNADFDGMRAGGGSAVAYAWFKWIKGHTGPTVVSWI